MNASVNAAEPVEPVEPVGPVEPYGDRPLSWSRTVAREWVHRASVAEVLLTDVRRARGDGFEAAASWPRSHPTFPRDGGELHSPLMVVETLRQLGICLPLRYFGVDPSASLVITDLHFAIDPAAEPRLLSGATRVTCRIVVDEVRHDTEGAVAGLRLAVDYLAAGVCFARAGGGARFFAPERYAAVRKGRAHSTAPRYPAGLDRPEPAGVGVGAAHDVVLGLAPGGVPGADGATLLVEPADMRHPYFFDHATDHLPGMIVLEAARQAAALVTRGRLLRPTAGRLKTARFVEYAPPARVLCVPHHATCVFRILQDGHQKAFGVLRYQ
ncbi:ScbA/BarX family gamma-butyrolactone biosynthesis protein [Streptomyces sp. NPDC093085]|uniref:ScbA/BarX family gamma-butyrolactone biosynthesis protein n=1 Tax=Streptomyces sp. NPDC093085 TaxID=3155068 RepID=UPI00344AD2D9